ncbi:MAG: hypothetical protein KA736_06185 [Crocinitomicaceae bacterium]|nr:hypothetical protein [Crocinitomicaceae bacterium]MBP6032105.1 hypothetical protein [Crocinitomicaceae bacterium]
MQKNEDSTTPEDSSTINEQLNENSESTDSYAQANDGNTDHQNQQGINTETNHESDNNLETLIQSTRTPI